ncbi:MULTISPECIES: hypothetical protein [Bacillaceae]|nr:MULTISPECIES: hypothetical protein [Bacillaceae]MEC1157838.1 hypothetical protein [Cytobacillus horneckiae]MED2940732.1 hypothetical protein [Cytobacillus horneckiae]
MKSLIKKFQSRKFVQNIVTVVAGKAIMLMVGLMIGYYLKSWLF